MYKKDTKKKTYSFTKKTCSVLRLFVHDPHQPKKKTNSFTQKNIVFVYKKTQSFWMGVFAHDPHWPKKKILFVNQKLNLVIGGCLLVMGAY